MKFLILMLLVSNIYAKDKNIFLDTQLTFPFSGTAHYIYQNDSTDSSTIPLMFLGVSVGYSLKFTDEYLLEPSLGYNFSSKDVFLVQGSTFTSDYLDVTLPLMYSIKDFKGGVYIKYMRIDTIDVFDFYNERINLFENKDAYALGMKAVMSNWFITYEYVINGKYTSTDTNKKSTVNIEGSRISIGLRNTF